MDSGWFKIDIAIDEFMEEPVKSVKSGRIAAQTTKQVIVQKGCETERKQIYVKLSCVAGWLHGLEIFGA